MCLLRKVQRVPWLENCLFSVVCVCVCVCERQEYLRQEYLIIVCYVEKNLGNALPSPITDSSEIPLASVNHYRQ